MGNVNEDDWIAVCPKCGDRNPAHQCPVTFEILTCPHCGGQVFPPDHGHDLLLFYHCQACGQRYLTPKLAPEDLLLELTKR